MIIIYYNKQEILEIYHEDLQQKIAVTTTNMAQCICDLSYLFAHQIIVWCHIDAKKYLNTSSIPELFNFQNKIISYHPKYNYLHNGIGYVDEKLFVAVNKQVTYPTWMMNSFVGAIPSDLIKRLNAKDFVSNDFDYFLTSLAKLSQPLGVFCYSDPRLLLLDSAFVPSVQSMPSIKKVFQFVKQHYKFRWVLMLFFNYCLYERKIYIIPFLNTVFYKKREIKGSFSEDNTAVPKPVSPVLKDIDVLIPTIGRKPFLYDVLKDLSKQTILPKNVIIIEQNPLAGSTSELDYLQDKNWPFAIKHIFTHRSGACNARNLGLKEIKSEWIFLADDDIRFESDFFEEVFQKIACIGEKAYTISCLRAGEKKEFKMPVQWNTFGSGCSVVKKTELEGINFDLRYEFGFGEDADFGMQLRNKGTDVIYLDSPEITHLKAPVGGFRTKHVFDWDADLVLPKPSPTIMLYRLQYNTKEQLRGYKTVLFAKFYKHQQSKNPFRFVKQMKKKWNASIFWAQYLINKK
ncbi:TPA: glycosyltransferase family 2 protein [Flavobacterium psychrophilum]